MIPPRSEDYVLIFEGSGVALLQQDVVAETYMPADSLHPHMGDTISSYVAKKTLARMGEEGLEFYKSPENLERVATDLNETAEKFKHACAHIESNRAITKDQLIEIFALARTIHELYARFDTWYTDPAYLHRDEQGMQASLAVVEREKNAFRDVYASLFFDWNHTFLLIMKTIGETFGLTQEQISWCTQKELLAMFDDAAFPREAVQRRKQAYVFYRDADDVTHLIEGTEALAFIEAFVPRIDVSIRELRGRAAVPGPTLRGRVRIINSDYGDMKKVERQMDAMEEGDILVSSTTAPDLMRAMKKAAAIITDVGGMLSHAAITSRELGTSCIVGTGNASKVLKDGDMVEVDAQMGIVRVL